ncbi:MAG: hypothetical protein V7638_3981 [Acidobacteriota bacterium]|jgi:hypothetical protein
MSEAAQRVTEKIELLIPRRQIRSPRAPLADAQERLWALYQLEPLSAALNICIAVRLEGKLDLAALKRAIATVVRRQEVLRTTFDVTADGRPFQSVHPPPSYWPLPLTDLRSDPLRDTEVRRLVVAEAARPFNLETGPTFRTALICLGSDEHVLLLSMHHIIADDWSIGILLREITVLYASFTTGTRAPLTNLPVQYADFAVWERQQKQIDYCRRPLGDVVGRERELFSLSEELSGQLRELGQGSTLFMTLLAAFQLSLHQYSGQQDILIGTNIANRNHGSTENLIGLFARDIVLHTNFSGNPTFRELLARAHDVTLDAPPFQVMLVFQNDPLPAEIDGLKLSLLDLKSETSNCDLVLYLTEKERRLSGQLHYNADLFAANTIRHLLDRFQNLLHAIVADPDARIDSLC